MNERQLAFKILNKIEKDNAYSNLTLDAALRESKATSAFSAFVTALVYGVTERKITLDYILSLYLTKPLKKLKPEVLTILRIGAYQILFMDRIRVATAVNESVILTKKNGCAFASGLVNSVLRKVGNQDFEYPQTENIAYDLSIRYSCPVDLVEHFIKDYGIEDTKGILESANGSHPLTAKVNTLKIRPEELKEKLQAENIDVEQVPGEVDCLTLSNSGAVRGLRAFQEGLFHIQDIACVEACKALKAEKGMTVLDMCAAPGGKSFTIAEEMQNAGKVIAFDLYPQRTKLIADGAKRLGIEIIDAKVGDAEQYNSTYKECADRILCDVPCSGFGIIGKKPEIRYKDIHSIDNLPQLQYNILHNAAKYLKKDGLLVYSTCTLNRAENDAVCDRFLEENPAYQKEIAYQTLMPHKNQSDGFFFAVFRRI